ncbi:MAG TPA: hypothetical protein VL354_05035 [Spirochaetia bacterium]|nr:hypothetical protein [Spirochaetia bacterium]
MGADIASASYYELVSWCRRLGLDDSGSRKDLQNRLADHYKVTLPLEAIRGKRVITVKSARESQYFTLADVNEKYVVLRGGVVIEIRDENHASVEEIKADSVTYNQTRHTMTAQGDVSYTITKAKETQNYTGKSFSVDLDSSEGVFYDGTTTKETTQGDTKLTYTFEGKTISRLSNNTVILKDGSFTTSQPVDPFWQIRASDVWILAPSEWAVDNAWLMVGRVPLLYIPAFFWPGDDLFFHPNPGYDNRLGVYIQTTTYLVGQKKTEDNPFSFLQLAGTEGPVYKEEWRGLFLRKIPGESPPPDNGTLKLLLDGYSRLGVFTGVSGDFPPLTTFRVGAGFSRSLFLYTDTSGIQHYTPFFKDTGLMYWNTSSFLGTLLPFRFGLDGSIQNNSDIYSLSWKFAYYSDPTFLSDFYNRSEGLSFSALLQSTTLNPVQTAATATQPNLSWDYVSKLDLTKTIKSPLIQSISFPTLNMNVTWQSRDVPGATNDPLASDPGHTFYYPSSITFPNVSFAVSGEILKLGTNQGIASTPGQSGQSQAPATSASTSTSASNPPVPQPSVSPQSAQSTQPAQSQASAQPSGQAAAPAQGSAAGASAQSSAKGSTPTPPAAPEIQDPGKGLRTPLSPKPGPAEEKKAGRSVYREPKLWPDANAVAPGLGSSLDVTYQVQPRATLQHTFDSTNWTTQQNIDYGILYQTLDTGGSGQLTGSASLWDRLTDVTTSFNVDGQYRQRFNPDQNALNSTTQPWQSLLQSDLFQDRLTLTGNLQTTVRPLLTVPHFSDSTLQHRLGLRVYQLSYTGVTPTLTPQGPLTPDALTDNTVQSTLLYQNGPFTDNLSLSTQILPASSLYTASEQAGIPAVSGKVQAQGSLPTIGPPQPLVFTSILDFWTFIEISEALQFFSASSSVQTSTLQWKFFWLTGSYVAQAPADGTTLTPSTLNLGLNTGSNPMWFWKDRIKVDASVQSSYNINLQNKLVNELDFTFNLNFSIYKFLDITFSSVSYNNQTYLYFAPYNVNPLTDLLKSFNFFNVQDRYQSNFKIRSLSVKLVHHLRDWDLSFEYSGSPQLNSATNAIEWTPAFTFRVKWLAVPFLQSTIQGDQTGVTVLN